MDPSRSNTKYRSHHHPPASQPESHTDTPAGTGHDHTPASTYINPHAKPSSPQIHAPPRSSTILSFHRSLPNYFPTPLIPLSPALLLLPTSTNTPPTSKPPHPTPKTYLKLESPRLTLPSFKILGASHAIHHLLCQRLNLPLSSRLPSDLAVPAREAGFSLVTASEGNWGRAVAHTAAMMSLPCRVYVPSSMDVATRGRIESEAATVKCVDAGGDYDTALEKVRQHCAGDARALMVLDTSWRGYREFPGWVTEGYETSMAEVDEQLLAMLPGQKVTHAFAAVGVGSWAHGVIAHYKGKPASDCTAKIVTVEPTAAACLRAALVADKIKPIRTGESIMCGMNCGTVSEIAWPVMREGVDASVVVTDWDAHVAVGDLREMHGIAVGPCGAAMLSALRRLLANDEHCRALEMDEDSVVVLYATEGSRPYEIPPKE
ncbi:MAG: hypothetical protein M1828_003033 [Chrysothrix sp. TS-e1954]|nr:MAG: hypothetical protein M1828_003033 [Chrysothrix sp. TS-e1954]